MSHDRTFHITADQARGLLEGTLPIHERAVVVAHLLTQCEPCLKRTRDIAFPERSTDQDYSGVLRRLELGWVVATNDVQAERRLASENWDLLKRLGSAQRMQLVRQNPRFRHWGIYERVIEEVKAVQRSDPFQAIDLTSLALLITENLDPNFYSESLRADFKAGALIAHANAKRLLGDFQGVSDALREAESLLESGTGNPLESVDLASIHSSMLTDLGYFEEADAVLQKALKIARSIQDSYLEGRLTIKRSSNIGWIDPIRGLELADRGLALLVKDRTREDKELELCAIHLRALWTNEAGDPEEARALFETYLYMYADFDDAFWTGRILHLQGHMAKSEGDLPQSESFFRQLVGHYMENHLEFDLALASLDLSEVLALQGRTIDSGEILQSFYPLLNQWKVNGEILRNWAQLKDEMMVRRFKLTAFRELSMILRRNWHRRESA